LAIQLFDFGVNRVTLVAESSRTVLFGFSYSCGEGMKFLFDFVAQFTDRVIMFCESSGSCRVCGRAIGKEIDTP